MDRTTIRLAMPIIMAIFWIQPLALGGWLALIPEVKEALELSKGALAIALLGMPIATVSSLYAGGNLVARLGLRCSMRWFFPWMGLTFVTPIFAWDQASLFAALLLCGSGFGVLEVAMNVYAGQMEKRGGVAIMSRCHGFWALGLMCGSGAVALAGGVYWVLIALSGAVAVTGLSLAFVLPRIATGPTETEPLVPRRPLRQMPRALFMIGGLMLATTMTEGAMSDWSAVYLAERLPPEASHAGIAVTIFSAFLAGGRFVGDALRRRFGAVSLARLTLGFAVLGLLLLVLPLPLGAAYLGFACAGFGISVTYPLGVAAVASLDDRYETANIAVMSILALSGFLLGPPLIGGLAELWSLKVGLAALIPALLLALAIAPWLGGGDPARTSGRATVDSPLPPL